MRKSRCTLRETMVSGPPRLLTEQRSPTGRQSRRRALYVRLAVPVVLVGLAAGATVICKVPVESLVGRERCRVDGPVGGLQLRG